MLADSSAIRLRLLPSLCYLGVESLNALLHLSTIRGQTRVHLNLSLNPRPVTVGGLQSLSFTLLESNHYVAQVVLLAMK